MATATVQRGSDAKLEGTGSNLLSIFARGLNASVLRAHAEGPLNSAALEERLGWAAEASLRATTAELCDLGTLAREGRQPIVTELTPSGRDLVALADALERWLSHSPFGALDLTDSAARGTVRALVAGWDSRIVQALAEGPRRLADLSRELDEHSYPALKRRFAKLRTAALVECLDGMARSPEYGATDLLRRAAGPLSLAARWEVDHAASTHLDERDLEAMLLLALPLVSLPRLNGSCLLVIARPPSPTGNSLSPTAIRLDVENGRIAEVGLTIAATSETWALASTEAWLYALTSGETSMLRVRGADVRIVKAAVEGIYRTLVGG